MEIRPFAPSDMDALIAFIAQLNADPMHHIGYFDMEPRAIRTALDAVHPPLTHGFRLAVDQHDLVGVLGVELDAELGRAWLLGPLLLASQPDSVADELFAALRPTIPSEIHEYELFCDAANQRCHRFAARHAIPLFTEAAILFFQRHQLAHVPQHRADELGEAHRLAFHQLHDDLFPRTYASAHHLLTKRSPYAKIFVIADDQQLYGYAAVKVDVDAGAGYIDYLGVTPAARQRGIGRHLLAAALHWMFSFPEVQRTDLTVDTSNAAARRLYASLGWEQERIMCGYRSAQAPA
jgi:ribosomal protein S18 acetylase RimI-like enzyme